jgi:hypothetical protein
MILEAVCIEWQISSKAGSALPKKTWHATPLERILGAITLPHTLPSGKMLMPYGRDGHLYTDLGNAPIKLPGD